MFALNAYTIKSLLQYYYRYEKKAVYADEIKFYNKKFTADLLGTNFQEITEIEVKLTKQDLLRDFINKEKKHEAYKNKLLHMPNYYMFCTPEYLIDETLKQIEIHNPNYGLAMYWNANIIEEVNPMNISLFFRLIKEPILITEEYTRGLEFAIVRKLSSEMANYKISQIKKLTNI